MFWPGVVWLFIKVFYSPCAFILERLPIVELSRCSGAETGHANQLPLGLFSVLQELWGLCSNINYCLCVSALWISSDTWTFC